MPPQPNRNTSSCQSALAYDADEDVYCSLADEVLTYQYTSDEDGLQLRRYWASECKHLSVQSRCTIEKEPWITRWEQEHLVEAM